MISLVQSKKQVLIEDNNRFKLNKKTMGLISHSFFNALINELDKYTIVNSNLLSYDLAINDICRSNLSKISEVIKAVKQPEITPESIRIGKYNTSPGES